MKPLVHRKAKRVRTKPVVRLKLHVTKGDRVRVIRGDDKGAEGTVLRVFPKTGRVTVEGVKKIKRHTRPTPTREGGIIEREAPIHHSNVMLLDGKGGFFNIEDGDDIPSHWMSYVHVADVDAAVAKVAKAGGEVLKPCFDVPGVGRIAIVEDPTGAVIGIMTAAPSP